MVEKTKEDIAEELRAEYRAAIQRTAEEEGSRRRQGTFGREGTKSMGLAYLFWFMVGGLGVHRFYLGRPLTGAALLVMTLVAFVSAAAPALSPVGIPLGAAAFIWWLIDAFLIPKMVP
jgi:TM2 domain-containing membrane protein YozV